LGIPTTYSFQEKFENEQPVKLHPGKKGKEDLEHRLLESSSAFRSSRALGDAGRPKNSI
jgi:hypothetical protein